MFDVTDDYSNAGNQPVRFIAEGRDASATIDAAARAARAGFSNDGDNEITGIHVSDGDPATDGILGAKEPKLFATNGAWRAFWTQQHGDNFTWELIGTDAERRWLTEGSGDDRDEAASQRPAGDRRAGDRLQAWSGPHAAQASSAVRSEAT